MKHQGQYLRRFLSHRIWPVSLIVLSVILLFLGHGKNDQLKEVRFLLSSYTAPVLAILSKPFAMANEAAKDVGKLVSLKAEVDRLKLENDKLRHLQTVAVQKDIKLKQLQNFLNLEVDTRVKYLTARVIANVNSPYKDTLRLNVGRENGVAKGQAVIDQNGFLGQVIRVEPHSSSVLLISDINSRIPVRLEPSGVTGMLVGKQNDGVELKYLPYGFVLKEETKIFTSGHGALLPAGILVGSVIDKEGKTRVIVSSDLAHVNYVKVLELKDTQREHVTRAVMKLPPLPEKRKSLRASLNSDSDNKSQARKSIADVNTAASHQENRETATSSHQAVGLLDLEKRASIKPKRTYRSYQRSGYAGWRYRQTYRDRRFQAQVFSGSLN